jgi:glycosyltransferase involved in cell wall biosynthesis
MVLISSLERGGAERQVINLVRHIDRRKFTPTVCSLSKVVPLAEGLPDAKTELVVVEKRSRYDWSTIRRVAAVMRQRRTAVVHAFHFDAEMVARLAARRAGVPVVIASERNSDYRRPWIQRLGQRLTLSRVDLMIANSESGKRFTMRTLGLPAERIRVIRSAVDIERFRPVDATALRLSLRIDRDAPVVGMVATFKRQKNHGAFLRMARAVAERFPAARFVCVGAPLRDNLQGADAYHREVMRLAEETGLGDRLLFLGNRDDMPEVYSLFHVKVLPSSREGTPNVLLEAMACGVPVVATDVADNSYLVPDGEVGFIVPVDDVAALTERVCRLLGDDAGRARIAARAREKAERELSTAHMIERTQAVYEEALRSWHARRGSAGHGHPPAILARQ